MSENSRPTDWITTDEAAQLSDYHPVYVRTLARKQKIHAEKRGGRDWWIDRASLQEYLDRMKQLGKSKHHPEGVGT